MKIGIVKMTTEEQILQELELIKKARRILINLATNRKTITYSELADKLELPTTGNALGRALSPILYNILRWSQCRGMPPLTAIVVNKSGSDKGLPGQGFWNTIGNINFNLEDKMVWFPSILKSVHDYWAVEPGDQEPFKHASGWSVQQHPSDHPGILRLYNNSAGIAYKFGSEMVKMVMAKEVKKRISNDK